MLVAIIRGPRGVAYHALVSLKVDLARMVRELASGGSFSVDTETDDRDKLSLSAASQRVVSDAVEEAFGLGQTWVGTEHLLLALTRTSDLVVKRVLGAQRVDHETVKRFVQNNADALVQVPVKPDESDGTSAWNVEVRGAYSIELSETELREIAKARYGVEDPRTLETVANEAASLEIVELGLGHGVEVEPLSFMRAAESSAAIRQSPVIFARNFKSHGTHLVNDRQPSASGPSALRCVLRGVGSDRRLVGGAGSEIVLPVATEWSDVIRDVMIQDVTFYLCTGSRPVDPVPEAKSSKATRIVTTVLMDIAQGCLGQIIGIVLIVLFIWALGRWF
ncbi:MAG: hypothetical protein HEQ23_16805 [Tepidisphaera sp.]